MFRILTLAFILSASTAHAGFWEGLNPPRSCELALRARENPASPEVGQPVTLEFRRRWGGKKIDAVFLGRNSKSGTLYFYAPKIQSALRRTILTIDARDGIKFLDFEGVKMDADALAGRVMKLSVEHQEGGTCAVHSSANCILYLAENGMLPPENPLWEDVRADRLLERFRDVSGDDEATPGASALREDEIEGEELRRLVQGAAILYGAGASQTETRRALLTRLGLRAETFPLDDAARKAAFLEHLRKKLPVILDLPTSDQDYHVSDGWSVTERLQVSRPGGPGDWHSVLAVGLVRDGRLPPLLRDKQVLVVDSGFGGVNVWSFKQLYRTRTRVTLVSPK